MKEHYRKCCVFSSTTPGPAESEHDETVKHSSCLKEQTGREKLKEIQLADKKVLSAEHTDF